MIHNEFAHCISSMKNASFGIRHVSVIMDHGGNKPTFQVYLKVVTSRQDWNMRRLFYELKYIFTSTELCSYPFAKIDGSCYK